MKTQARIWLVRLAVVLVFASAWTYFGQRGPGMARVFPGGGELLAAGSEAVASPTFLSDLVFSVKAIGIGFAVGGVGGLILGAVVGASQRLTRLLEPMFYWASSVPKIILLPIMLLIFGSGVGLPASHATLSSLFPVALGTITAVHSVPQIYTRVARSFGLTGARAGILVWVPAASGQVLTALRIGLSNAVVSALLVETAIGSQGLGYRAIRYYSNLQIAEMYAVIAVVFVSAMLINVALERLIRSRTQHFEDVRAAA